MARYDTRSVQRIRFAVETTYGADATGDVAANFGDLRSKPTVIMRETPMAPNETSNQRFHQQNKDVLGPRRGSCAIEAYWTSTAEVITELVTATKDAQQEFLETVFGGYVAPGAGSLSVSGEATTGCIVTTSEGDQFAENTFVGIIIASVFYPRLLATADPGSDDTLVWWPELPSAITNGATVHNAQNIFYDETTEKWLQILSETAIDRGNIWLLRGGAGDFKLSLQRGGLVTWTCSIQGAVHVHDDEFATPQGGSAIAAATFVDTPPIWGNAGGCHLAPTSDSTLTLIRCVEIDIDFGINWIETPMSSGVEGVGEFHRDRGRKIVTLTVLKDAGDGTYELYDDAWKAETNYGFLFWLGATGGKTLAVAARTCQIIGVEPVDFNNLEALKITLLCLENDKATDTTTTGRRSPIVLGHL